MALIRDRIRAVLFDYGNTLIEFGPPQVEHEYGALVRTLTGMFGSCDAGRLRAVRDRQIVAPFSDDYRESDFRAICGELIQELYRFVPTEEHVDALVKARYASFLHVVELPDGVVPVLRTLGQRYRLALISNYPNSASILDSLAKIGLTEMFEAIVISGTVGYVKPHPRPFEVTLEQLRLAPGDCVYVGDNWLADVQGAKRIGMQAIHTSQYAPYERFDPADGDYEPDARITHLSELIPLLL